MINLKSFFQWYDLDWLKQDIDTILNYDIKICNLFTEPVETREIVNLFKKIYSIDYIFQIEYLDSSTNILSKYDLKTKYSKIFASQKENYIRTCKDVLGSLEQYFHFTKIDKRHLCVSNICIDNISDFQFACILKLYGIQKVQIAPTKLIGNWDNLKMLDDKILKNYTSNGMQIHAFQSIAYGLDFNIFDESNEKLLNHLKIIIDAAENNNVDILIFGCPNNRKIFNNSINNEEIFINFFRCLGDYCTKVKICIENVSSFYKCNYLNLISDCDAIVKKINHPKIKTMIDIGNALIEKDEWYDLTDKISNLHNIDVSNKFLKPFLSRYNNVHSLFSLLLNNINYNNVINLEMIINENELNNLCISLQNFIEYYGKN